MLRGVSQSSLPTTGALVFDNLNSGSIRERTDASGDMMPRNGLPARDQVSAGIGDSFSASDSVDAGSGWRKHTHDSQSRTLPAQQERFI